VVVSICQGKSNNKISALCNLGEQTIGNMLTKDGFRAFCCFKSSRTRQHRLRDIDEPPTVWVRAMVRLLRLPAAHDFRRFELM
jgi:hypothetical protein